jgi:hypothetical protein
MWSLGKSRSVDTHIENLLGAVDAGDWDALGPLADFLEEAGHPAAPLARSVMELEPRLIAEALCTIRAPGGYEPKPSNMAMSFAGIAGLFGLGIGIVVPLVAQAATDLAKSAVSGRRDIDAAQVEVEEALQTRKLSADVASAITLSRLIKRDRLLSELREEIQTPS